MANRIMKQNQMKAIKSHANQKRVAAFNKFRAVGIERLEYDIADIENSIAHCKYDLAHAFKGSLAITNKMQNQIERLKIKNEELAKLKLEEAEKQKLEAEKLEANNEVLEEELDEELTAQEKDSE